MATLEMMKGVKRTSKYMLERQQDICNKAVIHCIDLKVEPRGLSGRGYTAPK